MKRGLEKQTTTNLCRISEVREMLYFISGNAFWALKSLPERDHNTQMIERISKYSRQN